MSFYDRVILPPLIRCACSVKPIDRLRARVVPQARGRVLEIGAGAGLNLRHYDKARIDTVVGLDVSAPLLRQAEVEAARQGVAFTPLLLDAAAIPLPDASVDTVLVTFTLCSIAALAPALAEMRRVLHPGGTLLFVEHGAAPDSGVARAQRWVEPLWKPLAGGCHLTRDPAQELERAGFVLERLDQAYLRHVWRGVGYISEGVARTA
ncbi:MAG: class I SAM-dependent methyltransferase [Rhodobacteraceae bacterium]|nr:class I SAM-dependent methyltransferase [Paracoccaceae bacterium]